MERSKEHSGIDEAQEMAPEVLSELRLLSSANFHATSLLTMVLSGDDRRVELLRHPDLLPLATRIRTRLHTEAASREQPIDYLTHAHWARPLLDAKPDPCLDPDSRARSGKQHWLSGADRISNLVRRAEHRRRQSSGWRKTVREIEASLVLNTEHKA